jgi:hypothetical protein
LLLGLSGAFIADQKPSNFEVRVHPPTMLGDGLILAGSVCYSTYLILIRKVSRKHSPITILRFVFLFGALFSLPFSLKSFVTAEWAGIFRVGLVFYPLYCDLGYTCREPADELGCTTMGTFQNGNLCLFPTGFRDPWGSLVDGRTIQCSESNFRPVNRCRRLDYILEIEKE